MSEVLPDIETRYARDGYVFPLAVMTAEEAAAGRAELERIERDFADRPYLKGEVLSTPHLLFPFVDEIMRRPSVLDPVSRVLGPDLLVWGCSFFIKEAGTPDHITWHQDLTYWGLDSTQEVTAWLALSPATVESGAMRFVPGSHRGAIVPHRDTFEQANLLSRGQEIAVEVDEATAVDVVLAPGEMSLHHGRLFHASNPNRSADRRIGLATRYISPDMRQSVGRKDFAVLVRGEDRFGHFELLDPPKGVLHPDDVARAARVNAVEREYFFADAEQLGHHAPPVEM
jgi:ectoine hydroxylase-related dioxygenase (phytanoyl-CoA dioxygenase family)